MPWAIAERVTLAEQATNQILRQIKDGAFKPGDRLPSQRDLARVMGVGIPVVREALQRLEVLGVVEVRQGQSTVIKPFSHDLLNYDPELFLVAAEAESLAQVLEARDTLEMGIVALAAQRAAPEDVQAIRDALEEEIARDHDDYETHRRLNNEFHLALAAASHNPVLIRMLRPLLSAWVSLKNIYDPHIAARAAELHRAIYEAVRARDPVAAQRAMQDHVAQSIETRRYAIESASKQIRPREGTGPHHR